MAERPFAFLCRAATIQPEIYPGIAQILLPPAKTGRDLLGREAGKLRDEGLPDRAHPAYGIEQLIREVEASTSRVHQSMIGKHENVLVESLSKRDERKVSGKGTRGITVTLDGTEADIGTIIPVTITSAAVNTLRGERTER